MHTPYLRIRNLFLLLAAVVGLFTQSVWATPIITSVVETGGDNEATDTIAAKWTGSTFPVSIANEPVPGAVVGGTYTVGKFASLAPAMVDRNHRYYPPSATVDIPAYLVNGEYIMSGNDNRDNAAYTLDVTVSRNVRVYMLIDNRLGDTVGDTPPTFDATHMQWILDQGWTAVQTGNNHLNNPAMPDEVGIDEGADNTLNQWFAVYQKDFPAGTFRLLQADNGGQNMYGVVIQPGPKPQLSVGLSFATEEPNGGGSALASGDIAGAIPQANWNNLQGANGNSTAVVADSAGTATPTTISVEWSCPNTWSSTGRGEENLGFAAGTPDRRMMTGYLDTDAAAGVATVTVSGIPADFTSGGYDVLVYCVGGVGGRGGAYTIGTETKYGTAPTNPTAHSEDAGASLADTGTYVRFRGQYGASFTLVSSANTALGANVNFRAPINAIQIVRNSDPNAGLVRGYLTKRRYDNIGTSVNVIDLLNNPKYINDQYDSTCLRTDFSANNADECDNCGLVVKGLFIPRVSGPHTFYISADDGAVLFLSTDDTVANKVEIAREPIWSGRRNYIGEADGGGRGDPPVNRSAPINLIAGGRYYIEGAVKEAGGGDNLDVAVEGPGDAAVADGDRPIFGDRIATVVDLTGSSLAITQNPEPIVRVPEGNTATFTIAATATSPLCGAVALYQWQRNGVDIPGANSPSYSLAVVTPGDHLAQFRCVVRFLASERISTAATLEVLGRECLKVVSAAASGFNAVSILFSTFITSNATVVDPFGYTVTGTDGSAVTVIEARLAPGGKSVVLNTEPQAENTQYTVVVTAALTSIVGSDLCAAPDNQTTFRSWVTGGPGNGVLMETYNVNNRLGIDDLLNNQPNYPNNPRETFLISAFDSRVAYADDAHEDYAGRLRGLFIPPVSGNWRFHMRSDDPGRLYINPNGPNAAGKIAVADQPGCCNAFPAGGAQLSLPFALNAGQGYYVEHLWREFGGGDYGQVAVQLEGDAGPTMVNLVGYLVGAGASPADIGGPVTITQQPTDQSVFANASVTFSVQAANPNGLPISYQWRRNGVDIPGATKSTYTFGPVTVAADNGAVYSVVAAVVGSSVTSGNALLAVAPDTIKPTVVSISGKIDLTKLVVRFSELVESGTAQDEFNYQIGGGTPEVNDATLEGDGMTVTLTLNAALTPDTTYQVTISGVKDLADLTMNTVTLPVHTFAIKRGFTLKELYLNIGSGVAVSDLTGNPKYPGSPDIVRYGGLAELNTFDEFENYGARLSGWLMPPVSGRYNFFMSSDDGGALYLSTDSSPANKVQIAAEPVWNGRRDWLGTARRNAAAPENRSSTLFPDGIELTAGQMYYFEALVKEGGGGDNLGFAWQIPGDPQPATGTAGVSGVYVSSLVDPTGAGVQITQQPTDQSNVIVPGAPQSPTTFSVAVTATGPNAANIFYQWMRDGGSGWKAISGANSASYVFTPSLADNGAKFRVEVFVPGAEAVSSTATLTVVQRNTAPQFVAGPNQSVSEDAGPQSVANWATGIQAFTGSGPVKATFETLPAGSALGGNAAVTGNALHLTDAVNSQQGSWVTPASPSPVDSLDITFRALIGGGTCCGDRTADGWSVTIGDVAVPVTFPIAAEEGAAQSSGFAVNFDSWDNGGLADDDAHTAPNVDIKVGGVGIAYQAFDGIREGGRAPSGPFITDPATGLPMTYKTGTAFTDVRVHLDPDGTVDVYFKGVAVLNNVQTGITLPLSNARVAFGARTGGANDNHWIDDLFIQGYLAGAPVVVYPPQNASPEPGQTVHFLVENSNPSLFSVQPAVSPTGTLTYTPAPNAFGTATVTVRAQDNGGTEFGGVDTSAPQTFTITVTPVNDCPTLASLPPLNVAVGGSVSAQLVGSDVDGDALQYAISTPALHGSVILQIATGALTYTPNPGYTGPDSFRATVRDSAGCVSSEIAVAVIVGESNRCPTAVAKIEPNVVLEAGQSETVIIAGNNTNACLSLDGTGSTDPDNDPLTYVWAIVQSDGTIVPIATGATATACLDLGSYRVRLIVDDGRCSRSADVDVEIITAAEAVDVLIDKVNDSTIGRNKRPFIASLKAAGASFDRGNCHSASGQLGAFVNKVRAQIAKGDPTLAAELIRLANAIVASVDCPEE